MNEYNYILSEVYHSQNSPSLDRVYVLILGVFPGNIGNTFEVHSTLGTLSLACPVDSSRMSEYMLTVQAADSGAPALTATVPVHILVITADDTLPRYKSH